jgi:hypothetical protein
MLNYTQTDKKMICKIYKEECAGNNSCYSTQWMEIFERSSL